MRLPTWGWTDRHAGVAGLLSIAMVGSVAGLGEGAPVALWVAATLGVTAVLALALDVWGGALLGLLGATALVVARRQNDVWTSDAFVPALTETLAILTAGAVAGYTGMRLRTGVPIQVLGGVPAQEYEALGLLSPDNAMARLDEEVQGSVRHGRDVVLVLFDVQVKDPNLPPAGRQAALRAVARSLEGRTPDHDVPFALDIDRLGVIFLDATTTGAWSTVGSVLEAVDSAHFTFGTERHARPLADAVDLYVGLAQRRSRHDDALSLLDAAIAALDRARHEDEVLG